MVYLKGVGTCVTCCSPRSWTAPRRRHGLCGSGSALLSLGARAAAAIAVRSGGRARGTAEEMIAQVGLLLGLSLLPRELLRPAHTCEAISCLLLCMNVDTLPNLEHIYLQHVSLYI